MPRKSDYTDIIADEMPSKVDIYALRDPRTGAVRYIGKANCARKRLASHLRDSRRRDTPVYRWIRKLSYEGLLPELMVLLSVPPEQWVDAEVTAIAKARVMGIRLLNVSEGGDQPSCPRNVLAENGRRNSAALGGASRPVRKVLNEMGRLIHFLEMNKCIPCNPDKVAKIRIAMDKLRNLYHRAKQNETVPELEGWLRFKFACAR